MSEKVRHVDYSPDEYISGVGGALRADEQGIYWMVCTMIMSEGGPVPYNPRRLAALCLVRPAYAKKVLERLIDLGKLTMTDDGKLAQKRSLSEVERSSKRIQTAIENGSKGGRPKQKDKQNQQKPEPTGFSAAKLTTNEQLPTVEEGVSEEETLKSPKPAKRRISYPARFQEFWSAYPTDALMSKAAAGKAFKALSEEDQDAAINSIPAFKAYCSQHPDYRPVHAVRYLTQGRFEGFNKAAEKVESREFVAMGTPTWEAIRSKRKVATMMHKEHRGQRGWWFDKAEIEAAMRLWVTA